MSDGCSEMQTTVRNPHKKKKATKYQQSRKVMNTPTYQKKLSELAVAQTLVPLCTKVQLYELTVPVEGDVLVDGGLAKDLLYALCRNKKIK